MNDVYARTFAGYSGAGAGHVAREGGEFVVRFDYVCPAASARDQGNGGSFGVLCSASQYP